MQQMARKAASPKINTILSITGYLKSPFQRCRMGQMISAIMMRCRQISLPQQMQQAVSTAVDSRRQYPKNYSHFIHMFVFYFWMTLQAMSWKMGNKATTPSTMAGGRKVVISMGRQMQLSTQKVEENAKGRQIHLMNPLRVRKTGQNSIALPQHLRKTTNKKVRTITPTNITPNDNANPLLQTKSPEVQKVSMFLLKSTLAVVSPYENAEMFIVSAKRQLICRNYNPLKQVLKKRGSRGATAKPIIENMRAAVEQKSLTTAICCKSLRNNYIFIGQDQSKHA